MKISVKFLILFFSFVTIAFAQKYQITTELKEQYLDKNGKPLTGKGVLIGDVDSGIDIFHPMFFFADGGEYSWIDTDEDGKITFGSDGVDLNGNGKIESNEILRYIEIKDDIYGMIPMEHTKFNPDFDFLYADKNGNKKRDFGPKSGFTESDPSYGEQLFIVIDKNKNGILDLSEKLVALKTSKVRAIRERNGTVRRRGTDLIQAEEDSSGHGTGVAGLILGGHYGVQKIHGIAPDAEIVVADIQYDYTPRFVRNFPDMIKFLRDEKINILLFEDGEWMWEFMDGSTEEEQLQNEMAASGITVIGGGGNLASGNMHIKDTLKAGSSSTYSISVPEINDEGKPNDGVYTSFLWAGNDKNVSFVIETPDHQKSPELSGGSDFIKVGKYNIFYARDVSSGGTVMFRFGFSRSDSSSVNGKWGFTVKPSSDVVIDGFVVDVSQSWSGGSHWTSHITDEMTVTFPSTSDSIMAIGAYAVNFGWQEKVGDLTTYSGRGYNINGKMGIDLTGPGHVTFTTEKNNGWMTFSGTSSAAPHVVGAAALLLSYDPALTHGRVRRILQLTADQDKFTGQTPNTNWGYGKLNIDAAIKYLMNNPN